MTLEREALRRLCLDLPGTTLEHSFGENHDVFKVGGKMFAIRGGEGGLSFKASDIAYTVLTETGRAKPAPYMARARWVHLEDPSAWPQEELAEHLRTAHGLIAAKLTQKARAELGLA